MGLDNNKIYKLCYGTIANLSLLLEVLQGMIIFRNIYDIRKGVMRLCSYLNFALFTFNKRDIGPMFCCENRSGHGLDSRVEE
ncbi:hypothetical protein RCL_jg19308.t1 [Rhizophagus clarus]|uniref:Uncharacterized protein n=1 Tax=Rhizophagus clarus TaxID=94130 RepID=A0A8H3M1P4_9GLOM|nr:hypothetical protein RCL_jg19308.t1 [Rhizophagus clarus]